MVEWSRAAFADLQATMEFLSRDDQPTASVIAARIWAASKRLDTFPEIGPPGRRHGTREMVIPRLPFLLVYRIHTDRMTVLRLLHTSQCWPPASAAP